MLYRSVPSGESVHETPIPATGTGTGRPASRRCTTLRMLLNIGGGLMRRTLRWLAATIAVVLGAMSLPGAAHADAVPSVAGTVTDRQTGAPVPGACVTVVLAADGTTKGEACGDAAGRYEIPALPGTTTRSGYARPGTPSSGRTTSRTSSTPRRSGFPGTSPSRSTPSCGRVRG